MFFVIAVGIVALADRVALDAMWRFKSAVRSGIGIVPASVMTNSNKSFNLALFVQTAVT